MFTCRKWWRVGLVSTPRRTRLWVPWESNSRRWRNTCSRCSRLRNPGKPSAPCRRQLVPDSRGRDSSPAAGDASSSPVLSAWWCCPWQRWIPQSRRESRRSLRGCCCRGGVGPRWSVNLAHRWGNHSSLLNCQGQSSLLASSLCCLLGN